MSKKSTPFSILYYLFGNSVKNPIYCISRTSEVVVISINTIFTVGLLYFSFFENSYSKLVQLD